MATGNKNNRSQVKNIRFPHELIEAIDLSVEREKAGNPGVNFSSWVLESCQNRLDADPNHVKSTSSLRHSLEVLAEIESVKSDSETDLQFIITATHEEIKRRQRKKAKEAPEG
ncbi:YlcI/YnfO family protein [Yersinia pseudotuberculosis]|uniref:YlcI/YnfO family protein n=1 Tax=Yersinia pseudotuberculosis TaxID=633 RepID=UPI0004F58B49|nr:YlcI/YnfO family protein [Yersinia pseudotuberculosis]AIN12865.1 hypothetical protein DJ40_1316 [Yersinia pseudotuberculosis]